MTPILAIALEFQSMPATRISIAVGSKQLRAAREIAKRDGVSLSAAFLRGLERELDADERRASLAAFLRDVPPISRKRKRELRARWQRKTKAA